MLTAIRPAAVAGMFYPGQADVLRREVTQLLAASRTGLPICPKALIVPHAGYVYSGAVAASAYQPLQAWRQQIRRVVLLGPSHRQPLHGLALPEAEAFATPLGEIPIDHEGRAAIADLPQVCTDNRAHAFEHSLEVQLPFLQAVLDDFVLLPLAVGQAPPEDVAEVLERLWGGGETLVVVSSDLSHYLPYQTACTVDEQTCRHILACDHAIVPERACGAFPLNGLLLEAKRRGLRPVLLDLRNSGDTAGDKSRVVGYSAIAFYEEEANA